MEKQNSPNTETGYLIVSVSTARNAIPIENALVTVYAVTESGAADVIYTTRTNRSGQTVALPLPAPPPQNSLVPGSPFPYAQYSVRVDYDGYYPVSSSDLTVFPGIVATLPVHLVPIDEFEVQGQTQIRTFPNHGLNTLDGGF